MDAFDPPVTLGASERANILSQPIVSINIYNDNIEVFENFEHVSRHLGIDLETLVQHFVSRDCNKPLNGYCFTYFQSIEDLKFMMRRG